MQPTPIPQRETSIAAVKDVLDEPSSSDANFIIDLENIEDSLGLDNTSIVSKINEDDCIHLASMDRLEQVVKAGNLLF